MQANRCYNPGVPRPVGIGAFVTVNHWQRRMTEEEAARLDDTVANFCAYVFAKLDTGDVVFTPPPVMGLGVPRDELTGMDMATFARFVAENVTRRPPPHPAEHAPVYLEQWERLAAELLRAGVAAAATDLLDLPFDAVVDGEARGLVR